MDSAKIHFSTEEVQLAMNASVILTKNRIMEKFNLLFGALGNELVNLTQNKCWVADTNLPKVSKGEKYLSLPYVIMDYPRIFTTNDTLALRTMFYWGHGCTVTLHVKGAYKKLFWNCFATHVPLSGDFYLQFLGDEWQHHITPETHIPLQAIEDKCIKDIKRLPFTKLVCKLNGDINDLEEELKQIYHQLIPLY